MTANAPIANVVNAGGATPPGLTGEEVLQQIATDCNAKVKPAKKNGSLKSCTKLGADKHACCENKIQKHRAANPPNGKPPVQGETGYKRPALDANNNPVRNADGTYPAPIPTNAPRANLTKAFRRGGRHIRAAFKSLSGNCYPDAAIIGPNGEKTFVDFKFPCPPGHPSGKGTSKGGVKTAMGARQQGSYNGLGFGSGGGPAITINP
jgi:hypothetical protein